MKKFKAYSHLVAILALAGLWTPQVQAQSGQHYVCSVGNSRAIYNSSSGSGCVPLLNEADFTDLISMPNILVAYHPGSIVRDGGTVKVWVAIFLASPMSDDKGRFRYDKVKASYKFFCKSREQLLIQGTYSLGHSRVYERPSNESVMEEIEPNTLSAMMLDDFCDSNGKASVPKAAAPAGSPTSFICPENLPNDAAREAQLQEFLRTMADEHPEMNTIKQILSMRVRLLEVHHCTQTLNNLHQGK